MLTSKLLPKLSTATPFMHFSPKLDTIIEGPFSPGPVRVIRINVQGASPRIEAVGIVDSQHYDRTIPTDQINAQVKEVF